MRFEHDFAVDATADAVYAALLDPERVGPCIAGAEVGAADDDGAHPARITVKVGPMRMTYRGTIRIVERDDSARRAVLSADVREARGQGSARARMTTQVDTAADAGAAVRSATEVELTGKAAQMGRGIIDDVAGRLITDMATRLGELLAAEAPGGTTAGDDAATTGGTAAADGAGVSSATRRDAGGPPATPDSQAASDRTGPPRPAPRAGVRSPGGGASATGAAPAPPVNGLRLVARVVWQRVRHAFARRSR